MLSLQELCCREICLFPEKTIGLNLDELNHPCLEAVVQNLSLYDLLKYETSLQQRGLDVDAAIRRCQNGMALKLEESYMSATTCPHLLDVCPRDGQNWTLSRILYRRVVRSIIDELWYKTVIVEVSSWSVWQTRILDNHDSLMQLFCPQFCSAKYLSRRKRTLLNDALQTFFVLASKRIFSIIVDLKFCHFFNSSNMKGMLELFFGSVQEILVTLRRSPVFVKILSLFKRHATKLKKICIYVIWKSDLLCLDEVLTVCSGVSEFHKTVAGKKARTALQAILCSCPEPTRSEEVGHPGFSGDNGENISLAEQHEDESEAIAMHGDASASSCGSSDEEDDGNPTDNDLMDDALLFGTACPPSQLDSQSGIAKAELKFTNLVEGRLYAQLLQHHFLHWRALRELHLGVPYIEPSIKQGLISLLKRPEFKALTLSSAAVSLKDMEDLLIAIAMFRTIVPLQKLMFVCLHTNAASEPMTLDNIDMNTNEEGLKPHVDDFSFEKLTQFGSFQGTELLELCWSGFCIYTSLLLRQWLLQDTAIRTLCFNNSLSAPLVTLAISSFASKPCVLLQHLILEDWSVNSPSRCNVLVKLLRKVVNSLTALSLKGCLVDRQSFQIQDIISATSACTKLETLDLSENKLGEGEAVISFVKSVLTQTAVKELSLRDNRLPVKTTTALLHSLMEIFPARGTRLDLLDLRGNMFPKDPDAIQHINDLMRRLRQRQFVGALLHSQSNVHGDIT